MGHSLNFLPTDWKCQLVFKSKINKVGRRHSEQDPIEHTQGTMQDISEYLHNQQHLNTGHCSSGGQYPPHHDTRRTVITSTFHGSHRR